MLKAINRVQVEELIELLERLSRARQARTAEGRTQSSDEITHDPLRRELTNRLYALSGEARDELILLMLAGRGDVEHAFTRALDTRSRYVDADDQVAYLLGKTVRLAEYLRIGLDAVEVATNRREDQPFAEPDS